MPVRITPNVVGPAVRAPDRNRTSTDGRWPDTGGPSFKSQAKWLPIADQFQVMRARRDIDVPGDHLAVLGFRHRHRAFRDRAARRTRAVKRAGMCCVISVGGQSAGKSISSALSASTPPVDAPISTIFPVGAADRSRACGHAATRHGARRPRVRAAALTLACSCRPIRHGVGDVVRRLGDEVDGADFERLERDLGARLGQRGEHHHRHRPQRHDLAQERHAVHVRHLDVERDDIGIERLDALARFKRIGGGADDLDLGILRQQRGQAAAASAPSRRR